MSVEDCRSVLINATYSKHDSKFLDWRLAESLTQREYDHAKQNASGNAVIYGVPIGANYEDFRKHIQETRASHDESLSESQVTNILWTGLDPSSADIYGKCIDGIKGATGLSLRVVKATDEDITLFLRWTPQFGQPPSINLTWSGLSLSSSKELPLPEKAAQGSGVEVIVKRPQTEQALAVKWQGEGDFVTLTPLPPPPEQRKTMAIVLAAVNITAQEHVAPNAFPQLFGPVLTNDPPGTPHANMAEWKFPAVGGLYNLRVEYAAAE